MSIDELRTCASLLNVGLLICSCTYRCDELRIIADSSDSTTNAGRTRIG